MNEYQEKFIKNKLDNEMSRDERFALAKELAERNRFEIPLEMEILNEMYNDKTPLEIIAEFCQDDFNVDDDYFMPDVGQGIKSMDNNAIDEWINGTVSDGLPELELVFLVVLVYQPALENVAFGIVIKEMLLVFAPENFKLNTPPLGELLGVGA